MEKVSLREGSESFQDAKKSWEEEMKTITLETLPAFLRRIMDDYSHDYGTICHAFATGAIATCKAMDRHPGGGITGFQAGAVMWQFIREWNNSGNKTSMRLVDYDNFLYPQYSDKFQKTLDKSTWLAIQKQASIEVEDANKKFADYLVENEKYKADISAFVAEYPDYYDRKEYYDPLGMGTGDQWEAEEKKKASGFKFAPQEPYKPVYEDSRVYRHWLSIIAGKVPFGYIVIAD